jgi:dinuclear metal center YbgI/SA1388 family protein
MPLTVAHVIAATERLWPISGAEQWDAPGFLSGDPSAEVTRVHLAVDAVLDTVDEAIELGAEVLLVHHPLLLRGVTSIAEDRYKGAALARLVRGGTALLAAHTNADVMESGTSATLAERLGLRDISPIVAGETPARGIGRVGALETPTTLGRLARQLGAILPATAGGIRVSGDFDAPVTTIALCAGAGDAYLGESAVQAADVYITSDLRHHPASEFRENARHAGGPALIDVSHWASEWLWLDTAAQQLREALDGVTVSVSDLRTDPWDFVVVQ